MEWGFLLWFWFFNLFIVNGIMYGEIKKMKKDKRPEFEPDYYGDAIIMNNKVMLLLWILILILTALK